MTDLEERGFIESLKYILLLVFPGLVTASVTSLVDFLRKHNRNKFIWRKFLVGQVSDLLLGAFVYLGAMELGIGEAGRIAIVILCVSNGRAWVQNIIDEHLSKGDEDDDEEA